MCRFFNYIGKALCLPWMLLGLSLKAALPPSHDSRNPIYTSFVSQIYQEVLRDAEPQEAILAETYFKEHYHAYQEGCVDSANVYIQLKKILYSIYKDNGYTAICDHLQTLTKLVKNAQRHRKIFGELSQEYIDSYQVMLTSLQSIIEQPRKHSNYISFSMSDELIINSGIDILFQATGRKYPKLMEERAHVLALAGDNKLFCSALQLVLIAHNSIADALKNFNSIILRPHHYHIWEKLSSIIINVFNPGYLRKTYRQLTAEQEIRIKHAAQMHSINKEITMFLHQGFLISTYGEMLVNSFFTSSHTTLLFKNLKKLPSEKHMQEVLCALNSLEIVFLQSIPLEFLTAISEDIVTQELASTNIFQQNVPQSSSKTSPKGKRKRGLSKKNDEQKAVSPKRFPIAYIKDELPLEVLKPLDKSEKTLEQMYISYSHPKFTDRIAYFTTKITHGCIKELKETDYNKLISHHLPLAILSASACNLPLHNKEFSKAGDTSNAYVASILYDDTWHHGLITATHNHLGEYYHFAFKPYSQGSKSPDLFGKNMVLADAKIKRPQVLTLLRVLNNTIAAKAVHNATLVTPTYYALDNSYLRGVYKDGERLHSLIFTGSELPTVVLYNPSTLVK